MEDFGVGPVLPRANPRRRGRAKSNRPVSFLWPIREMRQLIIFAVRDYTIAILRCREAIVR